MPLGRGFFIVSQAVYRRDGRAGGCSGTVGVTRVFRETRISRGDIHAAGGGSGGHCDGDSLTRYDENDARETSAHNCEYVTNATNTRVRNTLLLATRPPVRRFFLIIICTTIPLPTINYATTTSTITTTTTATTTADRVTDTGKW